MNLSARLDKLERTDGAGPVIVIWQNHDETDDVAIARWCAAHPDEPTPDPNSSHVCLIRWEDAVATGDITPDEGEAIASIFDAKRRAIDTIDVLARIEALERRR